ncbi:exodeoxyribonuclease X C-terminal domain-containing protein [Solitalea koreensis]|uniref:Exodeoxyribonuclease X-like C-terminal domain-containing protein n=1 Tax=Solitalea koreensis TaxID=543615 RepID=A0A521CMH9_9SPHI|nr:hypothetical protein [Solitalea koreensis]SMO60648.1 hypothetical protein SAMN06265350_104215 [Solitalea koreensis]
MHFYDLESELKFGHYQGKTLEEVVKLNPDYIEQCVRKEKDFFITAPVIEDLMKLNPDLSISEEAIDILETKRLEWVRALGLEEEEGEDAYAYFDEEAWKQEFGMPDDDDETSMESLDLNTEVDEQELNPELQRANFAPAPPSYEEDDLFSDLDDFPYEGPTGEDEEDDWDD